MIIGLMVKEFNIRRGEGLYFRVRFEYLIKKKFEYYNNKFNFYCCKLCFYK